MEAECAANRCDSLAPGTGERVCLQLCGTDGDCPGGLSCELGLGGGGYCRERGADAGTLDGGLDGAMAVDVDEDGVPSSEDCDDGDPGVGRSGTRPCASGCDSGLERCTSGVWAACDAPVDCTCDTPGANRTQPCGRCGMQSQTCRDGTWQDVGACLGQGECMAGAVEIEETMMCGERQRLCDASCAWMPWEVTVPDGECVPGACECGIVPLFQYRCTDECIRIDEPECDQAMPCAE